MTRRLVVIVSSLIVAVALVVAPHAATALPVGAPTIGMVCTPGTTTGSTHAFNLIAKTGYIDTPDGNSVFMWSYANADAPDSGRFQSPGPVLCVTQGQLVTVTLTNQLEEASSVVFPGQTGVTAAGGVPGLLTTEAAPSGSVTYSFTAGQPGTYLYESGSDIVKQAEMGLYGALVVRPSAGAGYAYDSTTQFDPSREYLLLLSEIDPDLHHAVETHANYDANAARARYFAINGREFPDTIQDNGSSLLPNQPYGSLVRIQPTTPGSKPSLIRMINVGLLNHPFHPHGNHTSLIAQDGRLLSSPSGGSAATEHFGETIGAGQTEDFLLRWDDQDQWSPVTNPLPVPAPNYRDVFFKDSNTWYSGSPYLGYKGTLPTGVNVQNICGEWYFPWHSHALNEFTNYDQGFGGMGTLLRVDPPGGCFVAPSSTNLVGGVLKSGSVSALSTDDGSYYQVNPKTTVLTAGASAAAGTMSVGSAAGFPTTAGYYVRVDNEVMQVTAGMGTTSWTVLRGRLGTLAATHAANATVTALATDWYAGFTGVAAGSSNLKVTYKGSNCNTTTATTCTAFPSNPPSQTVRICDWTVSGATGCAGANSAGWVTLPAPPAQPVTVGATQVQSTWTLPGSPSNYIGTGSYRGQVRVLVHTDRWAPTAPTPFSTWGNLFSLTYDAP
ncbi:multicopper oxidase domain-containing protein [Jatrophihabitans telluris]|uniref:Multicopper oxidase domain-containing protein n=1 Tax=Jatrophihabitans telluris TaxID=2038343 RepID=A0ABY4QYS4_9ACTN|nr:multicopper oxidase domain-containing protein [Jatrophihabitans telluris]UQX88811.1 multicopper oxidase domain-containing protein [Jatrophihabitans telluris]